MAPDKEVRIELYRLVDLPGELEDEDPEITEYEIKHRAVLVQDVLKQEEIPF